MMLSTSNTVKKVNVILNFRILFIIMQNPALINHFDDWDTSVFSQTCLARPLSFSFRTVVDDFCPFAQVVILQGDHVLSLISLPFLELLHLSIKHLDLLIHHVLNPFIPAATVFIHPIVRDFVGYLADLANFNLLLQ